MYVPKSRRESSSMSSLYLEKLLDQSSSAGWTESMRHSAGCDKCSCVLSMQNLHAVDMMCAKQQQYMISYSVLFYKWRDKCIVKKKKNADPF